jgi:hypothetical protein
MIKFIITTCLLAFVRATHIEIAEINDENWVEEIMES